MINQMAFVVENGMVVTKVMIKDYRRGFFIVNFPDGSFSALRSSRLFLTKDEAERSMEDKSRRVKITRRAIGYDSPYRYIDPRNRYGA